MSQTKTTEAVEDLKDQLEVLLDDALEAKNSTLTKAEKEALVQRVMKRDMRGFVRYRNARKLREAKKLQQERAAKVASSLALSVGGSAAVGMVAAFAAPSLPAIAVAGAVAGLIGGAWSAWVAKHRSDDEKKPQKKPH